MKLIKIYNSKVFKSNLLQRNYHLIENLWQRLKRTNFYNKKLDFLKRIDNETIAPFEINELIDNIKDSGDYFNKRISKIYSKKKSSANESGMTAYYRKSMHFLVCFSYLSDVLFEEKIAFKYNNHKKNEKFYKIDDNKIAENLFNEYKRVYENSDSRGRFINSIFDALFFYHYSYPKIFNIENNIVKGEIKYDNIESNYSSVIKSIKKINRLLKIKGNSLSSTIDNFNSDDLLKCISKFIAFLNNK